MFLVVSSSFDSHDVLEDIQEYLELFGGLVIVVLCALEFLAQSGSWLLYLM